MVLIGDHALGMGAREAGTPAYSPRAALSDSRRSITNVRTWQSWNGLDDDGGKCGSGCWEGMGG